MEITEQLVTKLLRTVDAGLVGGIGEPIPGKMCIEAAVCYVMGLPHSDKPSCVGVAVREFKIRLNDYSWSSDTARAAGLRKLGVAQLGSDSIDQMHFARIVCRETIRQILPIALRNTARGNPKHAESLEEVARLCEAEPTVESARKARKAKSGPADNYDYDTAFYAFNAANTASYSASYAASAAFYAATAVVYAAYAARAAAADSDSVLNLSAKIGLEALIELKSPGCEWLYLCE